MRHVGVIAGTGFYDIPGLDDKVWRIIDTEYGEVKVLTGSIAGVTVTFVPRHGKDHTIPPHNVNFKANVKALKNEGVEAVIGINSVGSLRHNIEPGMIVIPDDYISLHRIDTFHDHDVMHIVPSLDMELRRELISVGSILHLDILDNGTCYQSLGPRLETPAEVRMIASYAHIVGMNMGSEATLCQELGLRYANISSVDNMANGLSETMLSFEQIKTVAKENHIKTRKLLIRFLEVQE